MPSDSIRIPTVRFSFTKTMESRRSQSLRLTPLAHLNSLAEAGPVPTLADGAILAIDTPAIPIAPLQWRLSAPGVGPRIVVFIQAPSHVARLARPFRGLIGNAAAAVDDPTGNGTGNETPYDLRDGRGAAGGALGGRALSRHGSIVDLHRQTASGDERASGGRRLPGFSAGVRSNVLGLIVDASTGDAGQSDGFTLRAMQVSSNCQRSVSVISSP
jgi:hypothetical protein